MCIIIDQNVLGELWDSGGNSAGIGLRRVIDKGKIPLVVGGSKMKSELGLSRPSSVGQLQTWIQQLQLAGHLRREPDSAVDQKAEALGRRRDTSNSITSNDHHIIALAMVSGARLLYSNDKALTEDFGRRELLDRPRGRVYSTHYSDELSKQRRELLAQKDLCTRGRQCS